MRRSKSNHTLETSAISTEGPPPVTSQRVDRGRDGPRPVFLLSSERSGSNLVRSILNTHTDVSAPHPFETAYPWQNTRPVAQLSQRKQRTLVRDVLINKQYSYHPLTVPLRVDRVAAMVQQVDEPTFLTVQEALYAECTDREGTSVWVSKYPGLWECLEELTDHYDDPRFIYLVRDPRDVALSFKTSNIELYHPYFSSKRWRTEQRLGIDLLGTHSERVHLIRYEDLLREPETTVKALCEFLGLPYEEAMLYYYETEDAQATSRSSGLFGNLSVPIKQDNFGKFRDNLPDAEVKLTEKQTREEMAYFDYERVHSDTELDAYELEPEEAYRRADRELERRAQWRYWRSHPGEQIRRQLTASFTAYLYLRYGLFG